MKKIALLIFPVILLFGACALEIANVIGPGGGYVYYDKGNYKDGWRYKECSPFDICELKDIEPKSLSRAAKECEEYSDEWYAHAWEIPDEADLKKILECFSYGLTRFSPDYYYLSLSVNQPATYKKNDPSTWEVVILHKSFAKKANGEVERVNPKDEDGSPTKDSKGNPIIIRVRPIRKF
jgi:hypothetical protein